jgi:hypothetical protein
MVCHGRDNDHDDLHRKVRIFRSNDSLAYLLMSVLAVGHRAGTSEESPLVRWARCLPVPDTSRSQWCVDASLIRVRHESNAQIGGTTNEEGHKAWWKLGVCSWQNGK